MLEQMKQEDYKKLIDAATKYYAGEHYSISDKEYDELLNQKLAEDPEFDIFSAIGYIPVDSAETANHTIEFPEFHKQYIPDGMMPNEFFNSEGDLPKELRERTAQGARWYYKYDGCSLILYYDPLTGELKDILTRSNETSGKRRYNNFVRLVPKKIPVGISALLCEVMVPLEHGYAYTSRNKANGLTSSKYKVQEIMDCCVVVCYSMVFGKIVVETIPNKEWELKSIHENTAKYHNNLLKTLPKKVMNNRITFYPAPEIDIDNTKSFKVREIIKEGDVTSTYDFLVDGVVIRDEDFTVAYKAYYLDKKTTTVESIQWARTELELLVPTLGIPQTEIEDTMITSCASGGVNNIISRGLAPGAEIEVARAGITTPQAVNVLIPNHNLEFPKCPCGHQFTQDDVIGQGLFCRNKDCSRKLEACEEWFEGYTKDRLMKAIRQKPYDIFVKPLRIMGMKASRKWTESLINTQVINVENLDFENYQRLLENLYPNDTYTYNTMMSANIKSLVITLNKILKGDQ